MFGFKERDDSQTICDLVSRLRYKPGWTLSAEPGPGQGETTVMFCSHGMDARGSGLSVEFNGGTIFEAGAFAEGGLEDGIVRSIFQRIAQAECHEAGEWFTLDGVAPFDPHVVGEPQVTLGHFVKVA